MEEHAARVLEFPRVVELVAREARTEPGRERCRRLTPDAAAGAAALTAELKRVSRFMELVAAVGPVPFAGIRALDAFLDAVRVEESYLLPGDLLAVAETLGALERIARFAGELGDDFADLLPSFAGISGFRPLKELIESCIDEHEEIRDEAGFTLAATRRQITATRRQLNDNLARYLREPEFQPIIQDQIVTQRNDRFVIPVKPNFRTFFPGIIHGHSRTHQTCFVEPLEIIGDNNALALLRQAEREEERRILLMIAGHLRAEREAVESALERAFELDVLQAKAIYGIACGAAVPRLLDDWSGGFTVRGLRHPLLLADLGPQRVVPVDIAFTAGITGLVISGANAGGKTATLKGFGLVSLMVRAGLPVPVGADSELPLFTTVLADIGDEQSISEHVSTFSAHLRNVSRIFARGDKRSLVLIDEPGVGTDPHEGSALALGILDELVERGGIFMVTTHYNAVKAHAYERYGVESVAVSFDAATGRPLFTLHYGVPGLSNALQVAARMGFDERVLARARTYLDEDRDQVIELAGRLEKRLAQVEAKERELFRLRQEAFLAERRYHEARAALEERERELRAAAEKRLKEVVREAEARFKRLLAEVEEMRRREERFYVAERAPGGTGSAAVPGTAGGSGGRAGSGDKRGISAATSGMAAAKEAGANAGVDPVGIGGAAAGKGGDVVLVPGIGTGLLRGRFTEVKKGLAELLPAAPAKRPVAGAPVDIQTLTPGDRVAIVGARQTGEVESVDRSKRLVTVVLGGNMRVSLAPEKLARAAGGTANATEKPATSVRVSSVRRAAPLSVLNLVGKRVEEAEGLLLEYLDQALRGGLVTVEIIHGVGTGRLREGVHEILRGIPYVTGFHHPEAGAGGRAVTVVELAAAGD
jgi:DNA mismatch repair protein MutS2